MGRIPPVSIEPEPTASDMAEQRNRLLRACRRWTRNALAAEDLVQEAILIGLRRANRPEPPRQWSAYLFGIARRLCHKWREQQVRNESRFVTWSDTTERNIVCPADLPDPLESLILAEREDLIGQALGALKQPVRELLIARYIQDLPMSEIAARMGVSENAATVRVHRGREALRRVMETSLREEAASHGLLDFEARQGWRETPLYCVRCGRERLIGRFESSDSLPDFALDCRNCHGSLIGMTSHVQPMDANKVLAGVSGFRAGLNRVNRWWQDYIASALENRSAPCIRCGRPSAAIIRETGSDPGLYIQCDACRKVTFYIHPTGLLYHSREAQAFWRQYPRMHNENAQVIQCEGRPALLTVFADRITSARIEMVFDRETLRCLRVGTVGG